MHWLHLCRGVRHLNDCPGYDTIIPSDGEASIWGLWGMWNTSSLPLLPGPLWPGVVVSVRAPSMVQIKLFDQEPF